MKMKWEFEKRHGNYNPKLQIILSDYSGVQKLNVEPVTIEIGNASNDSALPILRSQGYDSALPILRSQGFRNLTFNLNQDTRCGDSIYIVRNDDNDYNIEEIIERIRNGLEKAVIKAFNNKAFIKQGEISICEDIEKTMQVKEKIK